MNRWIFTILIAALLILDLGLLLWQRTRLREAKSALHARQARRMSDRSWSDTIIPDSPPSPASPSPELLQLRNEVTLLHQELTRKTSPILSPETAADDWAFVHSGSKPSDQPDFAFFTALTNIGFATPETAFQSFNDAMRHQDREPLNDTRMKALWDLPDDFDQPGAKYLIGLGEGMGNEIGYRIVKQERVATNEIRLILDYERPDGSSFRREKILVERNGTWHMKPASLTRAQ